MADADGDRARFAQRPRPSSPARTGSRDNAFKIELAKRTIVERAERAGRDSEAKQ